MSSKLSDIKVRSVQASKLADTLSAVFAPRHTCSLEPVSVTAR